MTSISDVETALQHIPPHDRDTWVRLAMAVKSEFGEAGRETWESWSRGAENYRAADAAAVWRSAKESGGVTIATLFHTAKEHGFDPASVAPPRAPTPAEIAQRKARAEAAQAKVEKQQAKAAGLALRTWAKASAADGHPYLQRKGVKPTDTVRVLPVEHVAELIGYAPKSSGEPLTGDVLIIPVKVETMSTLEFIDATGRKAALYGGKKSGGLWSPAKLPKGSGEGLTLAIAEGVATALSIHESGDLISIAALSAGNLPAVAERMRNKFPAARMVICGESGGGLKHAERAAQENGATLAVWPGGDMNDLHQAQGLEAVQKLIESACTEEVRTENRAEATQPSRRFSFIRAADAIRKQPDPQWMVKGLLEQQSTVSVMGPSGGGKTFFILDIGLSVAAGRDWHGQEVANSGPVLYVCGEGRGGIARRVDAWRRHHGIEMENTPFYISSGPAQMLDPVSLRDVEQATTEVQQVEGGLALIVIDTLNRNFGPGDENSTADMTRFVAALDGLRDRFQCAIAVVHHTGHNATERGRGSSALYAALDFEYRVARQGETVQVECTKSKDFEPLERMTFKAVAVEVGTDSDGEPVTSLVFEQSDEPPTKNTKLSPQQRIALEALKVQEENGKVGVHIEDWRSEAYARGIADTTAAKQKAFARARTNLLSMGQVLTRDDLYWTPGHSRTCPDIVRPCLGSEPGQTRTHPLGVSGVRPPDSHVEEFF